MTLHQTIKDHTKEAMIAKDETRTLVLRGVSAEIQKEMLKKNPPPPAGALASDDEALAIIKRLVKQRKDSIDQFNMGGRPELALAESKELKILETYLPASMPRAQIMEVVRVKKAELGITDKSGAGKLIGAVSRDLKGKAEGSDIKAVVDELLG